MDELEGMPEGKQQASKWAEAAWNELSKVEEDYQVEAITEVVNLLCKRRMNQVEESNMALERNQGLFNEVNSITMEQMEAKSPIKQS